MIAEKAKFDVLKEAREHVRKGTYILREHAIERQAERIIGLPDVLRVLEYGRHESSKDIFDIKNQCWKYAIRGRTLSGFDLRVIVRFREKMAIITVIRV